jgi:FkbM family methyltransferase
MPGEGAYKPYPFAGGLIYLDVDESPHMRRRVEGTYEPHKVAAVQRLLAAGGTFVDVGANKGDFSLIAARTAGPEGRVIAFEPVPENANWARKSVELNGYPNVELLEVALSDSEGEAEMHLGKRSGWHSLVSRPVKQDKIAVRTRTLDAVLAERGSPAVDMLKIDVEGAELAVLRGARQTLAQEHGMWILLDVHPDFGVDPAEVAQVLRAHEFELRSPEDPERELEDVPPETRELFAFRA